MIQFPTFPIPSFQYDVTVDDVSVSIEFNYVTTADRWFFSMYDSSGNAICEGVKVVRNLPLVDVYRRKFKPLKGDFYIIAEDASAKVPDDAITYEDITQNRFGVYYIPDSELPAVA